MFDVKDFQHDRDSTFAGKISHYSRATVSFHAADFQHDSDSVARKISRYSRATINFQHDMNNTAENFFELIGGAS